MQLNKILFTLITKKVWLNNYESIKILSRKEFYLFWLISNLN
jgi:hypothetical protein